MRRRWTSATAAPAETGSVHHPVAEAATFNFYLLRRGALSECVEPVEGILSIIAVFVNSRSVGVLLLQSEMLSQRFIEPLPQENRESSGLLRWPHVHAEVLESVVRSFFGSCSSDQELGDGSGPVAPANVKGFE